MNLREGQVVETKERPRCVNNKERATMCEQKRGTGCGNKRDRPGWDIKKERAGLRK